MVTVYILQSLIDHGYYIGITKDIDKRLIKHNKGGVSSTRRRKPFLLVYTQRFTDYNQARQREKELKSYKGGIQFKELLKHWEVV